MILYIYWKVGHIHFLVRWQINANCRGVWDGNLMDIKYIYKMKTFKDYLAEGLIIFYMAVAFFLLLMFLLGEIVDMIH